MASDPYPDKRRGQWLQKYKPVPGGPWVRISLGPDPRLKTSRPPSKPPQHIIDRANEFREIEFRAKHHIGPAPVARAKDIDNYLLAYVDVHATTRRKGSTRQVRRHVKRFLEFCHLRGINKLQGVTKAVCRDYLEKRIGEVAASTLKTERGYLVGVWSRAVQDELIGANPWAGAKVPAKSIEAEPTYWLPSEIDRIVQSCRRPLYKDLVAILANTGLRISTALGMTWDWIDWRNNAIRVPMGEEIKTSYTHVLNPLARSILERRQIMSGGDNLVFPNPVNSGRIPYDTARYSITRAIKLAKVTPGTPHDLRHSYARALAVNGTHVSFIKEQLGHSSLMMTQRYIKANEKAVAENIGNFTIGTDPAEL